MYVYTDFIKEVRQAAETSKKEWSYTGYWSFLNSTLE